MQDDYLAISKINTVIFCPRRYYIEVVLAEQHNNHHMIEGAALHDRTMREGEGWVWSDSLGIIGIADQIKREDGKLVPYEYKKGFLAEHKSDMLQLCAIAMCLEERNNEAIERGVIYYHSTRRRLDVAFDSTLRLELKEAITLMRLLNNQTTYPNASNNVAKCKGCSVKDACQPVLARAFQKRKEP